MAQCRSVAVLTVSPQFCIGNWHMGAPKKVSPYNLLLIVHQRFNLILYYFAWVMNVYINTYLLSYISVWLIMRKLLYCKLNAARIRVECRCPPKIVCACYVDLWTWYWHNAVIAFFIQVWGIYYQTRTDSGPWYSSALGIGPQTLRWINATAGRGIHL